MTKINSKKVKEIFIILFLILSVVILPAFILYYYSFIQTNYISDLNLKIETDYNKMLESSWNTPYFQDEEFVFEIETGEPSNYWWNNVTYCVNYYNMGTTEWFKSNCTEWGEWGYSFNHLTDGALDGMGIRHYGGYPTPPKDKQEAYNYMREYVINFTENKNNNTKPWIAFNGHYPFHHYAAEFGFDKIGTEIGENMESYQMLLAFNRGAARQYQLPWFVDFSAWYGGGITDYNEPGIWGDYSGSNKGHSLSLFNRSYYMTYMSGTSRLVAEGGSGNFFYRYSTIDENGLLELTPLGELGRKFIQFTQKHPNRGISYNPIALCIDEYHGTAGFTTTNIFKQNKAFNSIPYSKGDIMTYNLLDIIFPGGWNVANEKGQLVNNEFGDVFDIILQNASQNVLENYPIIFLSGAINLNSIEEHNLINYVANGGTLIVNSAYFPQLNHALSNLELDIQLKLNFAESVKVIPFNNQNQGQFIIYGPDFDSSRILPILRELISYYNPFKIENINPIKINFRNWGAKTDIQYMINRNEDGWILTLINNDGISKSYQNPPIINKKESKTIKISLNKDFISKNMKILGKSQILERINDWTFENTIWEKSNNNEEFSDFTLNLNPGDIKIFEFIFS